MLRIGLDFDNTIVCYDEVFHRVGVAAGLIPSSLPPNKLLVREHLRTAGRESAWTALQGEVYGPRMTEAAPFPGVLPVLRRLQECGIDAWIVSHRTRHPFVGPPHDLHEAAREWISRTLVERGHPLVAPGQIFFELTRTAKLARIAACDCALFLDDLPEILLAPEFPDRTERLLFDPERHHAATGLPRISSWAELPDRLERQ